MFKEHKTELVLGAATLGLIWAVASKIGEQDRPEEHKIPKEEAYCHVVYQNGNDQKISRAFIRATKDDQALYRTEPSANIESALINFASSVSLRADAINVAENKWYGHFLVEPRNNGGTCTVEDGFWHERQIYQVVIR
jgi:hypothetical protein